MKLDKLRPGILVYDVHPYTMGNTTARSIGIWLVRVISIDTKNEQVTASWNGNKEQEFSKHEWSKWRLKQPVLIRSGWGHRLQTRAEKAEAKNKGTEE